MHLLTRNFCNGIQRKTETRLNHDVRILNRITITV